MNKKTLELVFKDKSDKSLKMSFSNPKNEISSVEIRALEKNIVDNKIFEGPTGDLRGFGEAYIREITETNLLD